MSTLEIPFVPDNVMLPRNTVGKMTVVNSDVFNISARVKEISPRLRIVLQDGHDLPWVVMEDCDDGNVRMVRRYERLDADILTDLQRMLNTPFEVRMREEEKRVEAHNAAMEKIDADKYEETAWHMRRALRDANMADIVLPSYRPTKHKRG